MSGLSYLVLYVPIVVAILLVLEACRSDDALKIARRVLSSFAVLTSVLVGGSLLVYLINRFL